MKFFFTIYIFLSLTLMFLGAQDMSYHFYQDYLNAEILGGKIDKEHLNYITLNDLEYSSSQLSSELTWSSHRNLIEEKELALGRVLFSFNTPELKLSYNSLTPQGKNDGPVWQGVGVNSSLTGGFRFEAGNFSGSFYPYFWFSENRDYDYMPAASMHESEYAYFTGNIDLPQRFGLDPLFEFDWGESEIRYDYKIFTIGLGTQSVWLGPAQKNPIILSSNAGGFPKLDLGLKPFDTPLGTFEFRSWLGALESSDYFPSTYDWREFSGLSVSYSPIWLEGVTLGFHRTAQKKFEWDSLVLPSLIVPMMSYSMGNDETDQRASLTFEYFFPEIGFNVYIEWARNDFTNSIRGLLLFPWHSQAYTVGLQKRYELSKERFFVLGVEHSQLMHSIDYQLDIDLTRGQAGFYTHHIVKEGYTNQGQLLGAGIGPGSDAQVVSVDYYSHNSSISTYFYRVGINKDYIFGSSDEERPKAVYKLYVDNTFGIMVKKIMDKWMLGIGTSASYVINYNYQRDLDKFKFRSFVTAKYSF